MEKIKNVWNHQPVYILYVCVFCLCIYTQVIASGNDCYIAIWKPWTIEMVDLSSELYVAVDQAG